MDAVNTKEIIIQLKATQKERNLSISDIMNLLSETNSPLGETTVRRVFKAGSEENDSFNYAATLKPLVEALAVHGKSNAETKLLLATNEYKNRQIEEITRQKDEMRAQFEKRCHEYETRMAFLRDQIELKDKRMDLKDEMINKLLDQVLTCSHCPVGKEK
jgi:rubrerythrin